MAVIYWKKKTKYPTIIDNVPYKGLCHAYALDNGFKTNNIVETGNKIIRGEETEILKRLLPNHYNGIDCIYYHISKNELARIGLEEFNLIVNLINSLLSEKGVLVISVDEKIAELINSLSSKAFSTNKNELTHLLNSIFINRSCTILTKLKGTTHHVIDLLRLNKLDKGNRKWIVIEPICFEKDTVTEALLSTISDSNSNKLSLNYFTMGEPLFIGNHQGVLNENLPVKQIREYVWFSETRTDYYLNTFSIDEPYLLGIKNDTAYYFFFEAGAITTLDVDSLSIIKTKAKQYIIFANNCSLPKERLTQNNIRFKKIPDSISQL
ncbi:MAG: hypothetical protein Q8K64_01070 [Sediminibacterium sp.]|nr:hypothetical protein [Sediminibacterium sp.]